MLCCRILENAALASETTVAWRESLRFPLGDKRQYAPAFACPQPSYYLIRKLVLPYLHEDEKLRSELFSTFSKAPHLELRAIASLCNYLCNDVRDDYLGIIHGIPHPDSDGNPYGNPLFSGSHPEWDYAEQVTRAALRDLMNVTHTLEDAIFNPPPPLQIQDEDQGRTEYGDSTDEEF